MKDLHAAPDDACIRKTKRTHVSNLSYNIERLNVTSLGFDELMTAMPLTKNPIVSTYAFILKNEHTKMVGPI
jgi:hypothetical protein